MTDTCIICSGWPLVNEPRPPHVPGDHVLSLGHDFEFIHAPGAPEQAVWLVAEACTLARARELAEGLGVELLWSERLQRGS